MPKILILDDVEPIRAMFEYAFSDEGYEVRTAENGRKALKTIEEFVPDIILLDVMMPEMSGPEFIRELRKLAVARPELAKVPFLVLTGENYVKSDMRYVFGGDEGLKGLFPKITTPDVIVAAAKEILK